MRFESLFQPMYNQVQRGKKPKAVSHHDRIECLVEGIGFKLKGKLGRTGRPGNDLNSNVLRIILILSAPALLQIVDYSVPF